MLDHAYGEWTVETKPTIGAEGVKTSTCAVCGETKTQAIAKIKLTTARVHNMEVDEANSTIVFHACENANNVTIAVVTPDGRDVVIDRTLAPITMTSARDRYGLTYANWLKENGNVATTLTVDGKTYNITFEFKDRELKSDDIQLVGTKAAVMVDNISNEIIIVAPKDINEISFYERSESHKKFEYDLENDENVTYVKAAGSVKVGYYTISSETESEVVKTMIVNKGRYCEKEYTLKVYFGTNPYADIVDELQLVKSTAAFDDDGVTLIIKRDGGWAPGHGNGVKKITKSGYTVTIENATGVFSDKVPTGYVPYIAENKANVKGTIVITDGQGKVVYSGPVIFDLGIGDGEIVDDDFNVVKELQLVRSTMTVDETTGAITIVRNSGLTNGSGNGIKDVTKHGYKVSVELETGVFTNQISGGYIPYIKDNKTNPKGTIVVTDAEGKVVYSSDIIFDLGLGEGTTEPEEPEEPAFNIVSELKPARATATLEEGNVVRITRREGIADGSSSGINAITASGYTVEVTDYNGVFVNKEGTYIMNKVANKENITGTIRVRDAEGNMLFEGTIIFDLGY